MFKTGGGGLHLRLTSAGILIVNFFTIKIVYVIVYLRSLGT
jgi:hypothetical protein